MSKEYLSLHVAFKPYPGPNAPILYQSIIIFY